MGLALEASPVYCEIGRRQDVMGALPRNFMVARSADFQTGTPLFTNCIAHPLPRLTDEFAQGGAGFYRIQSLKP
jgi:hypothetical protein